MLRPFAFSDNMFVGYFPCIHSMDEFMNYTYPTNTKKYSIPIIIDKGFSFFLSFFLFPFCNIKKIDEFFQNI